MVNVRKKIFPIRIDILDNENAVFNTAFEDTWEDFKEYYLKWYWVTDEMLNYLEENFSLIKEEATVLRVKEML